jgi:hypothetical protein
VPRAALLVAVSGLLLTASGGAQTTRPPAPKTTFVPRFEVVAETRLIMEGLAHSNYRSLHRLLKDRPKDNETWVFARGQAILIAETGNLLLLRPPRNTGRDTWMKLAMDMRSQAANLARSVAARDHAKSKAGLTNLTNACNRCHQAFRVPVKVAPDPVPGEMDASLE